MRPWTWLAAAALAVCAAGSMSLRALRPAPAPAAVLGDFGPVPDFELTDARSRRVRRADLLGAPWAASFIFTRCGGQCPMMVARQAALARKFPRLRLVSFSVDPEDTPAVLSRYARAHGAGWTFLTGGPGEVQRLSREGFKLPASDGGSPQEPILHSSKLALVDAAGRIRGYFDPADPAETERLAALAGFGK